MTSTHPLATKRVVVTRSEGQTAQFIAMLREVGAVPIVFPTIQIAPLEDYSELDRALQAITEYDWVIFTSVNGVRHVIERMQALNVPIETLKTPKVVAVGATTEGVIRQYGIEPALRPDEYVAEAIVAELERRNEIKGKGFLLLRVDVARTILRDQLREMGAIVDEVPVYRTVLGQPDPSAYEELRAGVDLITFTSSLTVRNFFKLLGEDAATILGQAKVACIGPITAKTAAELGLHVDIVASEYTMSGLMDALTESL